GRDQRVHAEMALDRDGRITAIRVKALHNVGAYMVGASLVPLLFSLKLIPSVYRVETLDLSTSAVFTHTAPTIPYRGAGRPEAIYVVERLLDLAASEMKIDRLDVRRAISSILRPCRIARRPDWSTTAEISPPPPTPAKDSRIGRDTKSAGRSAGEMASFAEGRSFLTSRTPACSTIAWSCASIRPERSPSWPGHSRMASPTRPPTVSASRTG